MLKLLTSFILKLMGWKVFKHCDVPKKGIMICAPHTSNWDFIYTMLGMSAMGIPFNWVAKHTLFIWPFGLFFRWMGGIPINRKSSGSFFKQILQQFRQRDKLLLGISPEGTRARTAEWKTGFYTLAMKTGSPLVMAYIDYPSKTMGVGKVLELTGDISSDFVHIRDFYSDKRGKFPEKQGRIEVGHKKQQKK